jgi:DNA-binding MarR family transcriptional regulator
MGLNINDDIAGRGRGATITDPDVRATLDAFRHIVQALRGGGRTRGAARVSPAQLFALQQIAAHPQASVNDIAARTFTHQSSVSVVIQRLVDARLVVKVPTDQDRRRMNLALTARGRRLLDRAPRSVQADLVAALSRLPAGDRRTLARLMTTVARAVTPQSARGRAPMFFEPRG